MEQRLIDANALKSTINGDFDTAFYKISSNEEEILRFVLDDIDDAPTIDPVKHGRWISIGEGYHWHYECSECRWKDGYPLDDRHRYCPNCGAQMDGGTP